ncbi:MAG: hypothetical protein NWR77_01070 [Burkholderiaceae bacterium]|nr:hypothetical protein [Burkholderiaceae bacterium]MDP4828694.1 hypothetical protein [Burkholderiaceae bacterium]
MGEQTGPLGTGKSEGLGWPPRGLLWALAFAVIYIVAFQLNRFFDPLFSVIEAKVSMIFLPAFVRVAAVLVAGLAGAMGLFAGAMVLGFMQELAPLPNLSQAVLTALAPCLAVLVVRFALAGRPMAITLGLFLMVALFASIFNSFLHHVFWDVYPLAEPVTLTTFWQMLVGDLAGALLGFGCFALLIRLVAVVRPKKTTDSRTGSFLQ